jgi:hypothetical protein
MHAMMAFVGAGRSGAAEAVLEVQQAAMDGTGDNAAFTREVGHAAARAIRAFGDGDYAGAVELLRPVRSHAHRFGGSHAQRDLIDLTLVEAAARSGQDRLVAALLAERADRKGEIPAARPRSATAVKLTATA